MKVHTPPQFYADELLDTIARAESNGNNNAYFGNANNSSIIFTSMTIGQVLDWQHQFIASGSPSSAVGRYQFIDTTLRGLVDQLNISEEVLFDRALQDKLARELLRQRGIIDYVSGNISEEAFANNLSKEWASLPMVQGSNPTASYYEGDGLNSATVDVKTLLRAIRTVRAV